VALENPLDHVTPPHPNDWIYFSDSAGALLGSLSVPAWLSGGLEMVFGMDPFEWVEQQFGGDWAAVSSASNMYTQFADWVDSHRHNAGEHAYGVRTSWDGNAAVAAQNQFLEMQGLLDEVPDLLREMAAATEWVASQMFAAKTVAAESINALVTLAVSAVFPPAFATLVPMLLKWAADIVAWGAITVQMIMVGINGLAGASQRLNALPVIELGLGYDNPLHA
jgi:hypothetical protein